MEQLHPKKVSPHSWWALSRFGARELLYGPLDLVVPPEEAGRWVEFVIQGNWRNPKPAGSALIQMCRLTEDRKRNIDQELRRSARIDAVEVVIDPQTQIPQLVVSLRYDDVDDTPEPAVIDTDEQTNPCTPPQPFAIEFGDSSPPTQPLAGLEASGEPDASPDATETPASAPAEDMVIPMTGGALRECLDSAAAGAGVVAKSAGSMLSRLGSTTS